MEEFLNIIRERINSIQEFLNNLQRTIGLKNANDDSIHGKLNQFTQLLNNIKIPIYYVETTTISNNQFTCTHKPMNGICINNEITLYHPDDGTLIWEGIEFNNNVGTLTDAHGRYDGWEIKVQYFYESTVF